MMICRGRYVGITLHLTLISLLNKLSVPVIVLDTLKLQSTYNVIVVAYFTNATWCHASGTCKYEIQLIYQSMRTIII